MNRTWKADEMRLLRRLYPNTKTAVIARKLKRTASSVHQKAANIGLRKSDAFKRNAAREYLWETGKAYRFPKGGEPWNKGIGWQAGGRSIETRFKRGNLPANSRPLGSERLTKDGEPEVKVANPNVWKLKKEVVWERYRGRVPEGMILRCKDGNRHNTRLRNLELITRARNMELNSIHRYPRELKFAMKLNKRLQREIERHEERH